MGARGFVIGGGIAVLAAGCGGSKAPSQPPGPPDPLQSVTFKELTGRVIGADSAAPRCPVTPHFEAVITVSHMQGSLRYRWALGDTTIHEVDVPAAAKTGSVDIPLQADEWPSAERGVQLTLTNHVHVLSPIDIASPNVDVMAKCF
jgi:hypothetical protein